MRLKLFLCSAIVVLFCLLAAWVTAQQLTKVEGPPPIGAYYSIQLTNQPPFPFDPFPELDIYSWGNIFFYDDSQLDYVAMNAQSKSGGMSTLDGPPDPGGGGGGSGGNSSNCPPAYSWSTNDLWLQICWFSNNSAGLVIHTPTNGVFDLFFTTNLATNLPGFNFTNRMWLYRTALAETNLTVTNLLSAQGYFNLGTMLDTDRDGLTDAYERLVSHTDTNSLSSADIDDDGMPDAWEWLNGLNPRINDSAGDADGDGISNLQEYLNEQQLLRPREPLGPCSRRTPLVISEIMYNPAATSNEFIEIYNSHYLPQKLDGFTLFNPGGPVAYYAFGAGSTIAAGAFLSVTPTNSPPNNLNNGGARIQLRNAQGAVLLDVEYDDEAPWPKSADGAGHSLVLARPSFGESDPRAWAASERLGGSPGGAEPNTFDPLCYIKINEILANGTNELDSIELYNMSSHAIDLYGCYLSHAAALFSEFQITNGNTVIPARGFRYYRRSETNSFTFGLDADGDQIYLSSPDKTRVIDSVRFEGQAPGVSFGRYPDGTPGFSELSNRTFGTNNAIPLIRNIVINEIMYNPISGTNADEYIELYNRGSTSLSLSNWQIAGGITFTFPNVTLSPSNFFVVAQSTNLAARYTNLALGTNLFGPYAGFLANSGERIALIDNAGVIIDEVTYGDGGRWGQWSDGGGSSLELIDPRSDNRLASNWADSDESAKSTNWVLISHTNYMDLGTNAAWAYGIEISLAGAGECLVDDVQVTRTNTTYVSNSSFSSGTNGWLFQGNHRRSTVMTNGGFGGGAALHVRASGRGDSKANRIWSFLDPTNLVSGNIVGLSARARWLQGRPDLLLRLHGNWLEATGTLPVPSNLGTPGAVNSRYRTNTGPAIFDAQHAPVLPAANQVALVTARIHDPDGLNSFTLRYRLDPSTTYSNLTMRDDGTQADAVASNGVYSAALPGQTNGALLAFYIETVDNASVRATNRFPAGARECLVRYGETNAPGGFGNYHLWHTKATADVLATGQNTSNEPLDATFVYGAQRVIYNAGLSYSGGGLTVGSYGNVPHTYMSAYSVDFPSDDRFLGSSGAVLDWPIRDGCAQREQVANWIAGQLGLYHNYRRFVHLFVNGKAMSQRLINTDSDFTRGGSKVYEDTQQPNGETLEQWFPGSDDGPLYKPDTWYEYHSSGGYPEYYTSPKLTNYFTTNYLTGLPQKKLAAYRAFFGERADGTTPDRYTNFLALVDALNTTNTGAAYTAQIATNIDMEQWMRVFAFEDVAANIDSFGNDTDKNLSLYKSPADGLWRLLVSDLDFGFGEGFSCNSTNQALFSIYDQTLIRLEGTPLLRRAYWRGLQDAVNGPLLSANFNPILDGHYSALVGNGIAVVSPDANSTATCTNNNGVPLRLWLQQRRNSLTNELAKVAAPFEISNNNGNNYTTNNPTLLLVGKAPVDVAFIRLNGASTNHPVTWTSVTNWTMTRTLTNGTNQLTVQGYGRTNNLLSNDTITVTYTP